MIYEKSLVSSVIDLLTHFDSCSCCGKSLLVDILHPSLLTILPCPDIKSEVSSSCDGNIFLENLSLLSLLTTSTNSNSPACLASPSIANNDLQNNTEQLLDLSTGNIRLLHNVSSSASFSTVSDISDLCPLPTIEMFSSSEDNAENKNTTEVTADSEIKHEISLIFDTESLGLSRDISRDLSLVDDVSYAVVSDDAKDHTTNDSSSACTDDSSSKPPKLIGIRALRNAIIDEKLLSSVSSISEEESNCDLPIISHSELSDVTTHPPDVTTYVTTHPSKTLSSCSLDDPKSSDGVENIFYSKTTALHVNSGNVLRKHVELHGRVARQYTVQSRDAPPKPIKLLMLTDETGSAQVTVRGVLVLDTDAMCKIPFISVKGKCEQRRGKSNPDYEVVLHSWSILTADKKRSNENSRKFSKPTNSYTVSRSSDKKSNKKSDTFGSQVSSTLSHQPSQPVCDSNKLKSSDSNLANVTFKSTDIRYKDTDDSSLTNWEDNSNDHSKTFPTWHAENRDKKVCSSLPTERQALTRYPANTDSNEKSNVVVRRNTSLNCPANESNQLRQNTRNEPMSSDARVALTTRQNAECATVKYYRNNPSFAPATENRKSLSALYAPTIYLEQCKDYTGWSVVTWGDVSGISINTAILSKDGVRVKLIFRRKNKIKSGLMMIEGRPFYANNNTLCLQVTNSTNVYYKECACLKYLSHNGNSQGGCGPIKRLASYPKIIYGKDLHKYCGEFVLMRAKLLEISNSDSKNRLGFGRVICADRAVVDLRFVSFAGKYDNIHIDDQVVLIGKVDLGSKPKRKCDLPWLTIEYLQVIPDENTDTSLGFSETALYEAFRQIVIEKMQDKETRSIRDPWSFLNNFSDF